MSKFDIFVIYCCAALTLSVMYAPQPLQPLFEANLGITKVQASLFTTSILVPLAIASIIYGYFLEKFSIKKILIAAFFCFGILEICFAFSSNYLTLLNLRAAQGLIVPAALTGIMSYISQNSPPSEVAQNIGKYTGITFLGGFVGRLLAGAFADFFGSWRIFFVLLGICLLIVSFMLTKISGNAQANAIKPTFGDIKASFKIPSIKIICIYIFFVFFSFQAFLNCVPFELAKIDSSYSGAKTGIAYIGFVLGIFIAFNTKKIVNFAGSAPRAMILGAAIFIIGIISLGIRDFYAIIVAMSVVCVGNFTAHSIASGYLNFVAREHKPIANGLYLSFYYCGGSLGSIIPTMIYANFSWYLFLAVMCLFMAISIIFAWILNAKFSSK